MWKQKSYSRNFAEGKKEPKKKKKPKRNKEPKKDLIYDEQSFSNEDNHSFIVFFWPLSSAYCQLVCFHKRSISFISFHFISVALFCFSWNKIWIRSISSIKYIILINNMNKLLMIEIQHLIKYQPMRLENKDFSD